jgi:guanylate kinase
MNNTLITLTGPSCAGKTTLEDRLIKAGFDRVISNTTRAPRRGEIDGVHYHFRTPEWFANCP